MLLLEMIYDEIREYIEDKKVLEIACGDGRLSKKCALVADSVIMSDVNINHIDKTAIANNIMVRDINAGQVHNMSEVIDTIVCLNGLSHMEAMIGVILDSCIKKVSESGIAVFAATREMDLKITDEHILPILKRKEVPHNIIKRNKYKIVIINPSKE